MKYLTLLLLLISVSKAIGQINIEKYNNLKSTTNLNGTLSFYASAKTGNTDVQEFGMDGRVNYRGNNFYSLLIGQGEYGWNKGIEYSNNALLHLRYIREFDSIINTELFGQINYNKSRLLLFRSLTGGGLRINFISDSLTHFTFGSAYMFEHEKLDLQSNSIHKSNTNHHRWSNYFSFSQMLTNNSRFSIVIYAQPRIDKFTDLRILSENHLGVGLTDKLSVSINFSLRYDSKPPDGVKDFDTNTKLGLSFQF